MWRIFQNALVVDSNMQRKGINLASRCVCCLSPSMEILEHLLIYSYLAKSVRSYYLAWVHKQIDVYSVRHCIHSWMHGVSLRAQCGYTVLGVIIFDVSSNTLFEL